MTLRLQHRSHQPWIWELVWFLRRGIFDSSFSQWQRMKSIFSFRSIFFGGGTLWVSLLKCESFSKLIQHLTDLLQYLKSMDYSHLWTIYQQQSQVMHWLTVVLVLGIIVVCLMKRFVSASSVSVFMSLFYWLVLANLILSPPPRHWESDCDRLVGGMITRNSENCQYTIP